MNTSNRMNGSWLRVVTALICLLALGLPAYAALPTDWQQWGTDDLLAASQQEQWEAMAVEEQHAVAGLVWTGFLRDGGAAAAISLADFLRLADRFHDRLDTARRVDLATLAQTRIPSDGAELASLGVWDIWRMRRVARSLGVEDATVVAWTQTYLTTNSRMFNEAGSPELGLLMDWANDVEQDLGTDMSSTRQAIVNYIDGLATASGGQSPAALYAQVRVIGTALSKTGDDERPKLAQQIVDLVQQNPEAFHGMTLWDLDYLRGKALAAEVDKDQISDWTLDWVLHADAWMHQSAHREINAVHDWVFSARTRPLARDAERRLTEYLCDRLAIDPRPLAMVDSEGMGLARVMRSLAPRLDEDELERLANHVADQFAQGSAIDGYHWDYENMASLFDTPQLRQALRDRLVDTQGRPRVKVGKLVTWMHRGSQDVALWRSQIEQKASDEQLPADQRARWLLIRADAASPVALSINDPVDATTPRMWAEQALAIAPDEPTRLECLKWIVTDDLRFKRVSEASATLTLEAPTFVTPSLEVEVQELQRRVSLKQADN